jgi:hypothetical protein
VRSNGAAQDRPRGAFAGPSTLSDVQANLAVAASVAVLKCSRPGTRSWLHHLHTTVLRESQG